MLAGRAEVQVCRDPSEDKFLAAAVEGKARYLVSGDPDLITLRAYRGITVVTPRQFLALLRRPPK
ncbi:MAG TPA: putative toxin-antitoxin system toxin component, PIN family [Candidatus Methylomirabilis sp.]